MAAHQQCGVLRAGHSLQCQQHASRQKGCVHHLVQGCTHPASLRCHAAALEEQRGLRMALDNARCAAPGHHCLEVAWVRDCTCCQVPALLELVVEISQGARVLLRLGYLSVKASGVCCYHCWTSS